MGQDKNLAVAKALDAKWRNPWRDEGGCWGSAAWYFSDGSLAWQYLPDFSGVLGDAFMAAELVGLFDLHLLALDGSEWEVWEVGPFAASMYGGEGERLSWAPTPALAICDAVLRLQGVDDEDATQ